MYHVPYRPVYIYTWPRDGRDLDLNILSPFSSVLPDLFHFQLAFTRLFGINYWIYGLLLSHLLALRLILTSVNTLTFVYNLNYQLE
jgi:hypothetical protein